MPVLFFWLPAVLVAAADLATKHLAFLRLDPAISYPLVPGLLNFHLNHNPGAVFGIGAGMRTFFILFTLLATVGMTWAAMTFARASRMLTIGLGLLLGGALGNLYDRITIGAVRDFIDLYVGRYHWPTFNVADMAICTGAGLIILHTLMAEGGRKTDDK